MSGPIECEGAPRDLGRDQGTAQGRLPGQDDALLRRLRDCLPLGAPGLTRWLRDVRRHFPHQYEWLEGLCRALGLPLRTVARAARAALDAQATARVVGLEGEEGAHLWRSSAADTVLRRVQPEGRFRSIELASPALPSPWIGVNDAGLAVTVTGGIRPGPCAAHAALLARDCLERFESVGSALAWCLGRPAAGGASVLLADSEGELAGVEFHVGSREVRRPDAGVLVLGPEGAELAKRLSERSASRSAQAALLAEALRGALGAASCVDVASRSLRASLQSSQSETARSGSSARRQ